MEIIVDDLDRHLLTEHKWFINGGGYVVAKIQGRMTYLHRLIMVSAREVDHVNRNKLDNRRLNLRDCDRATNVRNTKIRSDNTSGHRGIGWNKEKLKWRAETTINGQYRFIGYFVNLNDAINARKNFIERTI